MQNMRVLYTQLYGQYIFSFSWVVKHVANVNLLNLMQNPSEEDVTYVKPAN